MCTVYFESSHFIIFISTLKGWFKNQVVYQYSNRINNCWTALHLVLSYPISHDIWEKCIHFMNVIIALFMVCFFFLMSSTDSRHITPYYLYSNYKEMKPNFRKIQCKKRFKLKIYSFG